MHPTSVQCPVIWFRIVPFALGLFAFGLSSVAHARLNVVTLPERDTVQLTIYNSVDLTMVKETRHLTFRRGLNRLEFSWANTLIDPTSVEFRALTHADEVDVLDVSFPPRVANTLEWRINSEVAGEVAVEIRYFTSGISWSADYVAEADRLERTMALAGNVRVTNQSGEDYETAQIRLVVGMVRLVEEIAALARRSSEIEEHLGAVLTKQADVRFRREAQVQLGRAFFDYESRERKKEVTKESLSEYFLYTVEGRDTIPHGWAKRLPSFEAEDVPITSFYKFEKEVSGDDVLRFYRFTNSVAANLGTEPLPDGAVKAFRLASDDRLYAFVGSTGVKYIPINEQVDLALGRDLEVMVRPALLNWEKFDVAFNNDGNVSGWTIREMWEIELQNSKVIPVVVEVRRSFPGDWSLETEAVSELVDARKVKFGVALAPAEKRTIRYTLTTRQGTNARR